MDLMVYLAPWVEVPGHFKRGTCSLLLINKNLGDYWTFQHDFRARLRLLRLLIRVYIMHCMLIWDLSIKGTRQHDEKTAPPLSLESAGRPRKNTSV